MKSIKDKIIKSDYVRWRDFEFLQPDGFKELTREAYQKLRNSIIENQFVESFKVWENGQLFFVLTDIIDVRCYFRTL